MTLQKMSLEGQTPSHFAQERKGACGMRGSISFWKELNASGHSRKVEQSEKTEESTRRRKTKSHFFGECQGLFLGTQARTSRRKDNALKQQKV